MRNWLPLTGLSVLMLTAAVPAAASDTSAVKQVVRTILAKANAGRVEDALALGNKDGPVIDEFAPFHWSTPSQFVSDFGAYFADGNTPAPRTEIVRFNHINIEGDRAYVVLTVRLVYPGKGRSVVERGMQAWTLDKTADGWRSASFAFFGTAGVDSGVDAEDVIGAAKAFASLNTPSTPPTAIVDEFAPYHWTGDSAAADWSAGLQKLWSDANVTNAVLHLSAPSELNVNGHNAYASFPAVITYKQKGKAVSERGAFAFALEKTAGSWHIASWAWATH